MGQGSGGGAMTLLVSNMTIDEAEDWCAQRHIPDCAGFTFEDTEEVPIIPGSCANPIFVPDSCQQRPVLIYFKTVPSVALADGWYIYVKTTPVATTPGLQAAVAVTVIVLAGFALGIGLGVGLSPHPEDASGVTVFNDEF